MEILSKPVSDIQKIIDMYKRLPSFKSHVEMLEDLVNLALGYGNTINLEKVDEKVILNSVLMYLNIDTMQFMSICNAVKEKYPSVKLKQIKLTDVGWIDLVFTNPRPDCEWLIKEGSISIEQWDSSYLSKVARIKYLDDIIDEPTQYHNVEKLKVLLT